MFKALVRQHGSTKAAILSVGQKESKSFIAFGNLEGRNNYMYNPGKTVVVANPLKEVVARCCFRV